MASLVAFRISSGGSFRRPYALEVNRHAISCPPSLCALRITRQVPINSSFECALQCALYISNASGKLERKARAIPAPHEPRVLQACIRIELGGAKKRSPVI